MEHVMRRFRLLVVAGLVALSLSAFAGTAAAAQGPAYTGACNMVLSFGVGVNGQGGMGNAMQLFGGHDNVNGDTGMWLAVEQSGNQPFTCNPA